MLARNKQGKVVICHGGERLDLTIVDLDQWNGGARRVRLGFDGPQSFTVMRGEVQEKIDAERKPA